MLIDKAAVSKLIKLTAIIVNKRAMVIRTRILKASRLKKGAARKKEEIRQNGNKNL